MYNIDWEIWVLIRNVKEKTREEETEKENIYDERWSGWRVGKGWEQNRLIDRKNLNESDFFFFSSSPVMEVDIFGHAIEEVYRITFLLSAAFSIIPIY